MNNGPKNLDILEAVYKNEIIDRLIKLKIEETERHIGIEECCLLNENIWDRLSRHKEIVQNHPVLDDDSAVKSLLEGELKKVFDQQSAIDERLRAWLRQYTEPVSNTVIRQKIDELKGAEYVADYIQQVVDIDVSVSLNALLDLTTRAKLKKTALKREL